LFWRDAAYAVDMAVADLDVLIVDDHEAMRGLLERVLANGGVKQVRTAADGAEALAALRERPAHLLLVDQTMPGMDGRSLVAAVRADATLGAPRIIMLSGHTGGDHAAQARAAGADAVLVKPISPRELLAAIEQVMSNGA
jgi:two-component system chemotaxis response regulator CheY